MPQVSSLIHSLTYEGIGRQNLCAKDVATMARVDCGELLQVIISPDLDQPCVAAHPVAGNSLQSDAGVGV